MVCAGIGCNVIIVPAQTINFPTECSNGTAIDCSNDLLSDTLRVKLHFSAFHQLQCSSICGIYFSMVLEFHEREHNSNQRHNTESAAYRDYTEQPLHTRTACSGHFTINSMDTF